MLAVLFAGAALLDIFLLSQMQWWGGSFSLFLVMLTLFRKGSTLYELSISALVFTYIQSIFVASSQVGAFVVSQTVLLLVFIIVVKITDRYARKLWSIMVQGFAGIAISYAAAQFALYLFDSNVAIPNVVLSAVLSIVLNCVFVSVMFQFLRLKPEEQ